VGRELSAVPLEGYCKPAIGRSVEGDGKRKGARARLMHRGNSTAVGIVSQTGYHLQSGKTHLRMLLK
jgi:hypothetical protein